MAEMDTSNIQEDHCVICNVGFEDEVAICVSHKGILTLINLSEKRDQLDLMAYLNEIIFNRLIAEDANTRQLRKIDNRGGRENASKMRLRVHFALQLCGVKEATNHNCRRFYIVVSIF